MLENGIIITLTGMGSVFTFLVLLVIAMIITSKIIGYVNKIFPEVKPATEKVRAEKVSTDEDAAVAIAVAMLKMSK